MEIMSESKVKDVTLSLSIIDHLFVAPEVNPFGEKEVELLALGLTRTLKTT